MQGSLSLNRDVLIPESPNLAAKFWKALMFWLSEEDLPVLVLRLEPPEKVCER